MWLISRQFVALTAEQQGRKSSAFARFSRSFGTRRPPRSHNSKLIGTCLDAGRYGSAVAVKLSRPGTRSRRGPVGNRLAGLGGLRWWELVLRWLRSKLAHGRDQLTRCHLVDLLLAEFLPEFVEMVEDATDSEQLVAGTTIVKGIVASIPQGN
jgi:hypothetical protein